jgi:hypothetical protein
MRSLNRLSTFWHYLYRQRGKCVPLCFPSVIPRTAKFVFTHWNFQFSRFQYTNLVKIRYLPKMRRRNYTNNMQSENSFSSSSKRNALPSSPYRDSTIFAVSTPHGRAALAIIRISGPRATDVSGLSLSLPLSTSGSGHFVSQQHFPDFFGFSCVIDYKIDDESFSCTGTAVYDTLYTLLSLFHSDTASHKDITGGLRRNPISLLSCSEILHRRRYDRVVYSR